MRAAEARRIVRNWFGDQLATINETSGFLTPLLFVWRYGYRGFKTFDERTGYPNVCVVLGDTTPEGRTGKTSQYRVTQNVHLQLVNRDPKNPAFRSPELEQAADNLLEDVTRVFLASPRIPGLPDSTILLWTGESYEPTSPEFAIRMLDFAVGYPVDHE